MPKFAANLHYLFTEVAFLDRFAHAAGAGFKAVEFQVPYEHPGADLRARMREHGLKMVLFDTPMGDWNAGDRGLAAIPGREAEFRAGLPKAAEYARALDCDLVHVMAGVLDSGADIANAERVYIENLRYASTFLKRHGVRAVIEPINRRHGVAQGAASYTTEGMYGYFLNLPSQALRVIEKVGSDNLFLHLDVYHMQLTEGRLAQTLTDCLAVLKHVQIAGVPGRHEPNVGEINYPYLFDLLDGLGYEGYVGCEYRPQAGTLPGLAWASRYGIGVPSPAR